MNTTLLIMAAGLGSRYGGNKQIDRIGPNGEILMEYSIHDAVEAGFDKVVFVIRKSMEELFRSMIGDKIARKVQVAYAFQEYDSLPGGFEAPAGRMIITARTLSRPWLILFTGFVKRKTRLPWSLII